MKEETMSDISPDFTKADHVTKGQRSFPCSLTKQAPVLLFVLALSAPCKVGASTCYGAVGNGRLAGGVQLPLQGQNFAAYSRAGVELGRTYVHSMVRQVVVDAYASLEKTTPEKTYVYGETGLVHGGPIRPHHTHQAGLSVDFMVPVLD
jgi:penicillin-insensitive murein endopeptidase